MSQIKTFSRKSAGKTSGSVSQFAPVVCSSDTAPSGDICNETQARTRCGCTILSPFRWRENREPTIFARDATFTYGASTGKTMGQIATRSVTEFEEKNGGRSLGTIGGISAAADKLTAQRNDQRMLARQKRKAA